MSLEIVKISIAYNRKGGSLDYYRYVNNIYIEKDIYLKYKSNLLELIPIGTKKNVKCNLSPQFINGMTYEILNISISSFTVQKSIDIICKSFTLDDLPLTKDKVALFNILFYGKFKEVLASHDKIIEIFDTVINTGNSKYLDKSFFEYSDKEIAINNMISLRMMANKGQ